MKYDKCPHCGSVEILLTIKPLATDFKDIDKFLTDRTKEFLSKQFKLHCCDCGYYFGTHSEMFEED